MFLPESLRCYCAGTGYEFEDGEFFPCTCIAGDAKPRYDYLRYANGGVVSTVEWPDTAPPGMAEVWVPCTCGLAPIKIGPYDGDDLTRVPWVPDCPVCNDTGWAFSHHIPADDI